MQTGDPAVNGEPLTRNMTKYHWRAWIKAQPILEARGRKWFYKACLCVISFHIWTSSPPCPGLVLRTAHGEKPIQNSMCNEISTTVEISTTTEWAQKKHPTSSGFWQV